VLARPRLGRRPPRLLTIFDSSSLAVSCRHADVVTEGCKARRCPAEAPSMAKSRLALRRRSSMGASGLPSGTGQAFFGASGLVVRSAVLG
jgi:hypothetical protein